MRMPALTWLVFGILGLLVQQPTYAFAGVAPIQDGDSTQATLPEMVSFAKQIKPILQNNCFGCHQPAKSSGEYQMIEFDRLLAGGTSGDVAVVPHEPDSSYLLELITPVDGKAEMPINAAPLPPEQVELVRRWIEQGAVNDSVVTQPAFTAERPPHYQRLPVITSLAVSPDGSKIAVNGIHEVALFDLATQEITTRLVGRSSRIESIAFSPDGMRLAVVGGVPGEFGELQVWQVASGELQHSISLTGDCLFGASWSPDGQKIAFGATDNTVRAIDSESGKIVLFQNVAEDWIRDTVFSADGSHLISVGRDMTCKLTEVATERFIDNITSITPGVLKGGISSVSRHPTRDEIVVGSADGIPKLYRIFRETKRVIGDDANLLRKFPKMAGRIQAVAVSNDGLRIAAIGGIDGQSELSVCKYDFDTTVPDDIKAINSKVVTSRSAEERNRLEEFYNSNVVELVRVTIPDDSLYSLSFSADGSRLFTGGSSGTVHVFDANSGHEISTLATFSLDESIAPASASHRLTLPLSKTPPQASGSSEHTGVTIEKLSVFPEAIRFGSPKDYVQFVAQIHYSDGTRRDVSTLCNVQIPEDLLVINRDRIIEPRMATGEGSLIVTFAEQTVTIPVSCDVAADFPSDFMQDVNPILGKLGCNGGTCHGSQGGKRGFKLSLRGYDPIFDVRALTDDLASRRVNVAAPDESLMLMKASGRVPHEGGALIAPESKYYQIIRAWVAAGAKLDADSPRVTRLTLEPSLPVLVDVDQQQQMRVVATYSDGSSRDVTREAFVETANQEVATVDSSGLATARRRGEAPILARYEGAFAATTLTVMGQRPGFKWTEPPANNKIDELVARKWERMKIQPSGLCDDYEFLRRVHLDLTGLPPSPETVQAFEADERGTTEKRNAMIDSLIGSPEFVDHWSNKWADLLQVNEKFLGNEGAAKFHTWIREQVAANVPYDQFVRSIISATGSNAENPAASYFKILRTPTDLMENSTHLFLATRFNCNKCHDHPFERWTQDQYFQTAAFFAQIGREPDPASGDRTIGGSAVETATPLFEIIKDLSEGEITHDRTQLVTAPHFPFMSDVELQPTGRREQFAQWLTSKENPYFASSYANRVWGYLMGVGLIEPIDDIRASNPPSNPQLLKLLTEEFVTNGFDTQQLIRKICQSRTYQLSSGTNELNQDDLTNYSHAVPRRLPAEVLFDTMYFVVSSSPMFPGYPVGTRAAQLPDAGAKLPSGLLATLGKPVRESACECERANDLHLGSVLAMVSGPDQASAINDSNNAIAKIVAEYSDNRSLIAALFLRVLNRPATNNELEAMQFAFDEIQLDHEQLLASYAEHNALVAPEYERLDAERLAALANATADLQAYIEDHAPELPRLEADRLVKIAELETQISTFDSNIDQQVAEWRTEHFSSLQWHVLTPTSVEHSSGASSSILPDRSVLVTENKGKTTTRILMQTDLDRVAAIRFEALAASDLPGGGPGLAQNGNFVISELILEMANAEAPDTWQAISLTRPLADFSQMNYDIAKVIDGNHTENGWAVVPELGKTHWATFQLATPIAPNPGTHFRLSLVQNHGDDKHQIGKFRVSFSPSTKPVGLSVSEELYGQLITQTENWDEPTRNRFRDLVRIGSGRLQSWKQELSKAKEPIMVDPEVQTRRDKVQSLSQPTPRDPLLVRMEHDIQRSTQQLERSRLTAAQDVTWALINSPAFLFNH